MKKANQEYQNNKTIKQLTTILVKNYLQAAVF